MIDGFRLLLGRLLAQALLALPVAAALPPYAVQHYTTEQGLSHNAVFALAQDSAGFVWLATQDGLDRFDGQRVRRYETVAGTALRGGRITTLVVDTADGLWIGLRDGLVRLQPDGRESRVLLPGEDSAATAVEALHLDGTVLWVASRRGLYRIPENATEPGAQLWLEAESLTALVVDHDELLVLQRGADCRVLRVNRVHPVVGETIPAPCLNSLTLTGPRQLLVDADQDWRMGEPLPIFDSDDYSPPLVAIDWQEGLVVAGVAGAHWRGSDGDVVRLWPPPARERTGRPDESVLAALVDRDGALWLGTYGGVLRLDPGALAVSLLGAEAPLARQLADRHVAALLRQGEDWWIGSFGDGLLRWTPGDPLPRELPGAAGLATACGSLDWSLLALPEGVLHNGLCLLDAQGLRWTVDNALPADVARGALKASDGQIWLTTHSGLYRLQGRSRARVHEGAFEAITEDSQGRIWLGAWISADNPGRGELWRLDPASGEWRALSLPLMTDVYDLLADDELIWVASSHGLFEVDARSGQARAHAAPPADAGRVIYSLIKDDAGRLWLGSNRGLLRFDPAAADAAFRHYDARDGLELAEFNRRSRVRDSGGQLLLGGHGGVLQIHPQSEVDDTPLPAVRLLGADSMDGQGRAQALQTDQPIVLDANSLSLSLAWTAPQFRRSGHRHYRYRLQGVDPDWVAGQGLDTARYPRLPAGRYAFEVQIGLAATGPWGPLTSLRVQVLPPWYRQPWFLALAAVLGLLLAILIHRMRVAQLIALERVRMRIAADLHDELGSELAAIGMSAELLARRGSASPENRLNELAESARKASESVRDVVWYVNPDKDSLADLGLRLQVLAQRMFADVDLSVDNGWRETQVELPMTTRRELHLLCREAFANILRHAKASRVELRLWRRGRHIGIDIVDDGLGFDTATAHAGSGVDGMQRRAAAIGAELQIDSETGKGTQLRLLMTH